jgi:succinate dehydrogenase / fumarate reductase cytochrome b subunit
MLIGSWLGRLILFGLTASLVAHFINGVRHLLLNAGMGFPLPTVRATGWMVMAATPIVTVLIWIAGYAVRGSL